MPETILAGIAATGNDTRPQSGFAAATFTVCDLKVEGRGGQIEFLRGDCNADGTVNVSDPVATLSSLFGGEGGVLLSRCL